MNNLLVKKLRWLNLPTSAQTKTLSTTSKNAATYWVSVRKLATPTILRLFFIIYFRKSSNTRVPPPLEAPKVMTFTQTWLMLQESIELPITTQWVPWTKGQMLIQVWAVNNLRTLLWLTLICKTVRGKMATLMVPTLGSSNCIDKLY